MSQLISFAVTPRRSELSSLIREAVSAYSDARPTVTARQLRIGNLDGAVNPKNTIFAYTYICWVADAATEYATAA